MPPRLWFESDSDSSTSSLHSSQDDEADEQEPLPEDLNLFVEHQIRNLIQLLSTFIEDICKDEKVKKAQTKEYSKKLKKCLASIESGLSEQINIMQESILSTDVNRCNALYDQQIENMDDMFQTFLEVLNGKLFSQFST